MCPMQSRSGLLAYQSGSGLNGNVISTGQGMTTELLVSNGFLLDKLFKRWDRLDYEEAGHCPLRLRPLFRRLPINRHEFLVNFLPQTKGAHCRFPFVAFGIVFACQQDLAQGLLLTVRRDSEDSSES